MLFSLLLLTFCLVLDKKLHESVYDYTARFNQVAQEVLGLSKRAFIQAYRHGLYNITFSPKLANKEPADINTLLSRNKTFIQGDDYVRRKRELENEVKDRQALKRTKPGDAKPRVSVQDGLDPCHTYSSHYDYTPLRVLRTKILCKVEFLGILRPPLKMMSPHDKHNRAKFCQFHQDHGHDTEYCIEVKKEIESTIKRGLLKEFIDDVSQKQKIGGESVRKSLLCWRKRRPLNLTPVLEK